MPPISLNRLQVNQNICQKGDLVLSDWRPHQFWPRFFWEENAHLKINDKMCQRHCYFHWFSFVKNWIDGNVTVKVFGGEFEL